MKNPKHRAEAAANWFLAGKVLRKEDLVEVVEYEIKKALRQQKETFFRGGTDFMCRVCHDRSGRQKCTVCSGRNCGNCRKPCGACEDCFHYVGDCQFCD